MFSFERSNKLAAWISHRKLRKSLPIKGFDTTFFFLGKINVNGFYETNLQNAEMPK